MDWEVDGDGQLVVRCDDEGTPDLSDDRLRRTVLDAIHATGPVRGVSVIADRERAYGSDAVRLLNGIAAARRLLDRFARRAPTPAFEGFTAREAVAVCRRCPFLPGRMFPALSERLVRDPVGFPSALAETVEHLAASPEPGCLSCHRATIRELRLLVSELEGAASG